MSLFDEKLPYGWNLRDLGCLLKRPEVPQVAGVTTPMTYFGMWKSFFAWHVVSPLPDAAAASTEGFTLTELPEYALHLLTTSGCDSTLTDM